MNRAALEFWFDFASPYSYVAAARIESLCRQASVPFVWRPFLLGPIFQLQGWNTSPFNLNERRKTYMWRDMERLTQKYGLPWKRPSVFPRNTTLACRVAAAFSDAAWIGAFIHSAFVASFGDDLDLNTPDVVASLLHAAGVDAQSVMEQALNTDRKGYLRRNTEEAIQRGIFGAPNCYIGNELFWGEETLEDAIEWAKLHGIANRCGMEPLDLTKTPPRSPYVKLGGLLMLGRTIDKMRALLPGGNIGAYQIEGFSKRLLDALGIPEDDMQAVVSLAATDDEIVAWVRKHSDASKYDDINAALEKITVGDRLDRPEMVAKYPILTSIPPETTLLRMLELDDARSF